VRRLLQLQMALAAANAKAPAPARGRGGRGDQRLAGALERVAELESENRELREQAARRAQVCWVRSLLSRQGFWKALLNTCMTILGRYHTVHRPAC